MGSRRIIETSMVRHGWHPSLPAPTLHAPCTTLVQGAKWGLAQSTAFCAPNVPTQGSPGAGGHDPPKVAPPRPAKVQPNMGPQDSTCTHVMNPSKVQFFGTFILPNPPQAGPSRARQGIIQPCRGVQYQRLGNICAPISRTGLCSITRANQGISGSFPCLDSSRVWGHPPMRDQSLQAP